MLNLKTYQWEDISNLLGDFVESRLNYAGQHGWRGEDDGPHLSLLWARDSDTRAVGWYTGSVIYV